MFLALASIVHLAALGANDLAKELDIAADLARPIIEHMPAKAAVAPEKPRRLLVSVLGSGRADADAKSAASDAARKLAEASSYRWTTTSETAAAGPPGRGGVTTGETEKSGFTRVAISALAGRVEFVTRGGKAAVLVEGNWRVPASPRRGSAGPGGLAGRRAGLTRG